MAAKKQNTQSIRLSREEKGLLHTRSQKLMSTHMCSAAKSFSTTILRRLDASNGAMARRHGNSRKGLGLVLGTGLCGARKAWGRC